MRRIISHRGNLNGPSHDENTKLAVDRAISFDLDVEIDVWSVDGILYLGHDAPSEMISIDFLQKRSEKLWIHAKNYEALLALSRVSSLNVFFHNLDAYTITTHGNIWAYPTSYISGSENVKVVFGKEIQIGEWSVCTDFPLAYLND